MVLAFFSGQVAKALKAIKGEASAGASDAKEALAACALMHSQALAAEERRAAKTVDAYEMALTRAGNKIEMLERKLTVQVQFIVLPFPFFFLLLLLLFCCCR